MKNIIKIWNVIIKFSKFTFNQKIQNTHIYIYIYIYSLLNIGLVWVPTIVVLVGPNRAPRGIITCMANQIILQLSQKKRKKKNLTKICYTFFKRHDWHFSLFKLLLYEYDLNKTIEASLYGFYLYLSCLHLGKKNMKLSKEKLILNIYIYIYIYTYIYRNIVLLHTTYKVMSFPCNYK